MIDWQVVVDGKFPCGWDPHRDGCWFPDFDMQRYLLPYFDVGEQPIDEYGATVFDGGAIRRLRVHLEYRRECLEAKCATWLVTETCEGKSYSHEVNRDAAIAIIDKTIAMIDLAIKANAQIVFRGD